MKWATMFPVLLILVAFARSDSPRQAPIPPQAPPLRDRDGAAITVAPAVVEVLAPDGATVMIDGTPMGAARTFRSEPFSRDRAVAYVFTARWPGGEQSRTVWVRGGAAMTVDLRPSRPTAVGREAVFAMPHPVFPAVRSAPTVWDAPPVYCGPRG